MTSTLRLLAITAAAGLLAAGPALAAPQGHGPSCPATSFNRFAKLFLDQPDIQAQYTRPMLTRTRLEGSGQAADAVSARNALVIYVDRAERRRLGMTNVKITQGAAPRVTVSTPDTDLKLSYVFEKAGCWFLVGIEDGSL